MGEHQYLQAYSGEPVTLYYPVDAPNRCTLQPVTEAELSALRESWYQLIGGTLLIYAVGVGMMTMRRLRHLRLLRDGNAAIGIVRKTRGILNYFGEESYALTYTWTDATQTTQCKEVMVSRGDFDRFPSGSEFTILCDPTSRFLSKPYFLLTDVEIVR